MKSSSPPKEDPAIKAKRDAAEIRAEAERIRAIQDQLKVESSMRKRSSGMASLMGPYSGSTSLLGAG